MTDASLSSSAPAKSAAEKLKLADAASAIVLSCAALATAFASYQADLWDGEQAALYVQANAMRVEASREALTANQIQGADLMSFGAWLAAHAEGETELEDFYRRRFRPQFAPVVEAWIATRPLQDPQAPATPFVMPQYQIANRARSEQLERGAQALFERGQKANDTGDKFVLATVILANALFFGGINQVGGHPRARLLLLVVSIAFLIVGIVFLVSLQTAP